MKSKLSTKREIEKNIDEYFNNCVKCEELRMKGKGLTYKEHEEEYWMRCHSFQEARLLQLKDDAAEELRFLKRLQKIVNKYHSEISLVEIGRQNVLNDIDNELKLDSKIKQLKRVLKSPS